MCPRTLRGFRACSHPLLAPQAPATAAAVLGSTSSAIRPVAEAWVDRLNDEAAQPAAALEFLELLYDVRPVLRPWCPPVHATDAVRAQLVPLRGDATRRARGSACRSQAAGLLGEVTLPRTSVVAAALRHASREDEEEVDDAEDREEEAGEAAVQQMAADAKDAFASGRRVDSCMERATVQSRKQADRFEAFMVALPHALGEAGAVGRVPTALVQWAAEASTSEVPVLRLAATAAAMAFGLGLCRLRVEASAAAAAAEGDAGAADVAASSARDQAKNPKAREGARRQSAAAAKDKRRAAQLRARAAALGEAAESLREAVFVHRFRDTSPLVRRCAVATFAQWVAADGKSLGENRKLRNLGWALNDRDDAVREAAASGLAMLLEDEAMAHRLGRFWDKFAPRVGQLLEDRAPQCAAAAVRCYCAALPWEMLDVTHVAAVERCLVVRDEAAVRRACGEFLLAQLPEMGPPDEAVADAKEDAGGAKVDEAAVRLRHAEGQLMALLGVVRRAAGHLALSAAEEARVVMGDDADDTEVEAAAAGQAAAVGRQWAALTEAVVASLWGQEDAEVLADWAAHRRVVLSTGRVGPGANEAAAADEEDEDLAALRAPSQLDGPLRVTAVRMLASCLRWAQGRSLQAALQPEARALAGDGGDGAVEEATDMLPAVFAAVRGEMGGLLAVLDLADALPAQALADPSAAAASAALVAAARDVLLRGTGGARPGAGARLLARIAGAASSSSSSGAKGKRSRSKKGGASSSASSAAAAAGSGAAEALSAACSELLERAGRAAHVLARVATGDVDALREAEVDEAGADADEDDDDDEAADAGSDGAVPVALLRRCRALFAVLADATSRLAEASLAADLPAIAGHAFAAPSEEAAAAAEESEAAALAAAEAGEGLAVAEALVAADVAGAAARGERGAAADVARAAASSCRLVLGCVRRGGEELGTPLVACAAASGMEAARAAHGCLQLLGALTTRAVASAAAASLDARAASSPEEAWAIAAPARGLRDAVLRVSGGCLADADEAADAITDAGHGGGSLLVASSARGPSRVSGDAALAALAAATRAAAWRSATEALRLCPPSLESTALWPLALPPDDTARWASDLAASVRRDGSRRVLEELSSQGDAAARDALAAGDDAAAERAGAAAAERMGRALRDHSRGWAKDGDDLLRRVVSAAGNEEAAARVAAAAAAAPGRVPEAEAAAATAAVHVAGYARQPAERAAASVAAHVLGRMRVEGARSGESTTLEEADAELAASEAALRARAAKADDESAPALLAAIECLAARRRALAASRSLGSSAHAGSLAPLASALVSGGAPGSSAVGAAVVVAASASADVETGALGRAALRETRARSEAGWVAAVWSALRAAVQRSGETEAEAQRHEEDEESMRASGDDEGADAARRRRQEALEANAAATQEAARLARSIPGRLGPSVASARSVRPKTRAGRTLVAVLQELQREVAAVLIRPQDGARARAVAERRRVSRGEGADLFAEAEAPDAAEEEEEERAAAEADEAWGQPRAGMSCRAACAFLVLQRIADPRVRGAVLDTFRSASLGLPRHARSAVLFATDRGAAGAWAAAVQLRLLLEGQAAAAERFVSDGAGDEATPRSTGTGRRRRGQRSVVRSGARKAGGSAATPSSRAGAGAAASSSAAATGSRRAESAARSESQDSRAGSSARRSLVEDDDDEEADDDEEEDGATQETDGWARSQDAGDGRPKRSRRQ